MKKLKWKYDKKNKEWYTIDNPMGMQFSITRDYGWSEFKYRLTFDNDEFVRFKKISNAKLYAHLNCFG